MAFFRSNKQGPEVVIEKEEASSSTPAFAIAKVFAWMALWLLITTVVALGGGALMNYLFTSFQSEEVLYGLLGTLVVSAIGIIVLSIIISTKFLKSGKSILPLAIVYSILMGVLCSSFVFIIDWYILGAAFGITTLVFGIMTLIALLAKDKLNGLAIAGMGLAFGALIGSLFMVVVMVFLPQYYEWYYWIITLALLCAVILVTIYDIRRIKTLAKQGALTKNLSMYLGFCLYNDFVYIFIKIMEILAKVKGNNN